MNINDCQLIVEKKVSKNKKEYCALYLVVKDVKIFLTFINFKDYEKIIEK